MLNQTTTLQRARMPVIAMIAFALGALASAALPQLQSSATYAPAATATTETQAVTQPTLVTFAGSESTTVCGKGAYVTGDLVGDASPATVYATMCER